MRIFIMCNGQQRRLPDLGARPKHLLEVNGEPILTRTLRMIRTTRGDCPPIVVVGPQALEAAAWPTMVPFLRANLPKGSCVVAGIQTALESPHIPFSPHQRTVVLLGDVVWSRAALDKVLADTRPVAFAGTPVLSPSEGEVFALGFDDSTTMVKLCETCPCQQTQYRLAQGGHLRRLLWHVQDSTGLQFLGQTPRGRGRLPYPDNARWHPNLYLPIDDWTDDVDTPADVANLPHLAMLAAREQALRHPVTEGST